MIKSSLVTQNSGEGVPKEAFHGKKKSGQNREIHPENHGEESDRGQGNYSKDPSHFDSSDFGMFFGNQHSQVKSNTEGFIAKAHNKKKSNETTSSKERTLKQASSKDYSNLEELLENTTIIPNTFDTAPYSKKKSNDLYFTRNESEDNNVEDSISKLGLDGNDETERFDANSVLKDNRAPKTKIGLKIKPKTSFPGIPVPDFQGFTGFSTKASASNPFVQFRNQDVTTDGSFGKKLERSTEIEPKRYPEYNQDFSLDHRKASNLSLLSSDSTIDSETFAFLHDSSSTAPFSGAGGSFGNYGKVDFNSPKLDSGRVNTEESEMNYMKNYSNHKSMKVLNPRMVEMPPLARNQMNLNQSCMTFYGGYGSGNNSDRSTNISFNDEYINSAFHSNFNTPQGRQQQQQQQSFFNQNLSVSNSNNLKNFFGNQQKMHEPHYRGNGNFNTINQNLNQSFTNIQLSNQTRMLQVGKTNNVNNNNNNNNSNNSNNNNNNANDGKTSRMKRKTQGGERDSDFEIDLYQVDACGKTSVMIRNIPNKYDRELMIETIHKKGFEGKFDFFYLPIDFSNQCNFGYGFINFVNPQYLRDFYNEFHNKKWEKFNSEKICKIRYAKIQGKKALEQHFENSKVMNQPDEKLKPYIQNQYAQLHKFKIEELVRQQKLEHVKDGKEPDSRRRYQ